MDLAALGLPVGRIRPTDIRPLVVVEPEPAQRVQQRQIAFLAVAFGVGVFQPEHEGPTGVAGVGPVEQRGANQANVWRASRRRAEPNSYGLIAPRVRVRHHFPLRTTGLVNVPMPSMVTLTVSPSSIGPTPSGVPVRIKSPGSSVITAEIHSTIAPMSWIISEVRLCCLTSPLTSVRMSRSAGSTSVTIHGPIGQKVSWPLARVHWPSFFC